MLDSRHWKLPDPASTTPFQLDGDAVPTSRSASRRTWISTAEGVVVRIDGNKVWIAGESAISLQHSLPETIDLVPLLGARIHVALVHALAPDGAITQTLNVTGHDGKRRLIAHAGHVKGNVHTLGALTVYAALSQRPGGPIVFGTARLQSLVRVGESLRVRDGDDVYVMSFQSRGASGAAYAIVDRDLWRGARLSEP